MDATDILMLVMAAFSALMLWRLAAAVGRNWDGQFEDLLEEDAIVRRLAWAGLSLAAFLAMILLRGEIRSLLGSLPG